MKQYKRISAIIALLFTVVSASMVAQTVRRQIVEDGGTGRYKAEIVADSTLRRFTVYKPANLAQAVSKEGKLPVILYANGACADNSLEIRYFLNELASHGYVAVAIGPYDEDDFFLHWEDVMTSMYPKEKRVILANGYEVKSPTPESRKALEEKKRNAKPSTSVAEHEPTYPRMLLEALDWLTDRNADTNCEYYHMLNLEEIAAMGQSCGGAQVLGVSHDPRITTCVMLNSGIGDMNMQGVSKAALDNLHTPMFYLIGGPGDVAFRNARQDFDRIENLPVVMINTKDEHEGTYYEKNGGSYAIAVRNWLDWQLKGRMNGAAMFLDQDYLKYLYPDWSIETKNLE